MQWKSGHKSKYAITGKIEKKNRKSHEFVL